LIRIIDFVQTGDLVLTILSLLNTLV